MLLLLSTQIVLAQAYIIHENLPKINITNFNSTLHLSFKHIQNICDNRNSICKANDSRICSVRYDENSAIYKDYENSCYLFLSNMCDSPGNEYSIISGGTCEQYFQARRFSNHTVKLSNNTVSKDGHYATGKNLRHGTAAKPATTKATAAKPATTKATAAKPATTKATAAKPATTKATAAKPATTKATAAKPATTKAITKSKSTFSTLYEVDTAFDFHLCPYSCPDTYSPVCVSANRGFGKYFKFFTFVNHCAGDLYYCKHWEEFSPPPDEDEKVSSSPLSWSYCGASRYLQFSRFAEAASSMGHYGWLAGDYSYSHIMEPNERIPGFG